MRFYILLLTFILQIPPLFSQETAKEVLEKSKEKCKEITNGRYTLERNFKFAQDDYPIYQEGLVVFEKQPADTLFGMLLWVQDVTDSFAFYYNSKAMHIVRLYKKTVTLDTAHQSMGRHLNADMSSFYLKHPFVKPELLFLDDTTIKVSYAPEWLAKPNKDTVIVLINYPDDAEKKISNKWTRWYFDKEYYPVMKEVSLVYEEGVQYEQLKIKDYSFNSKQHSNWLRQRNWTADYDSFYYIPKVPIYKRLPNDTIAPDWKAETVNGDSITFSKLKAKCYLIDFWYRSCKPCIAAMPALQNIHKKYASKGLQVIGLNPYDYAKREGKDFRNFIKQSNVDYHLAFIEGKTEKDFWVEAFPTLYFMDATGKVLYSQTGYTDDTEQKLETFISEYLETH